MHREFLKRFKTPSNILAPLSKLFTKNPNSRNAGSKIQHFFGKTTRTRRIRECCTINPFSLQNQCYVTPCPTQNFFNKQFAKVLHVDYSSNRPLSTMVPKLRGPRELGGDARRRTMRTQPHYSRERTSPPPPLKKSSNTVRVRKIR